MNDEKIQVRVTSSGQLLEVVVLNKRMANIQVVLGEGVHNVHELSTRRTVRPGTLHEYQYQGAVEGRRLSSA